MNDYGYYSQDFERRRQTRNKRKQDMVEQIDKVETC